MSCNSCSSDINSVPKGCKSNGSCGTGDCEKLSVFDWLANMALPAGQEPMNIVEVRFKNGRKHFFKNLENLQISIGDVIAVEGNPGHDIGTVSLTGELIKVQLKRKGIALDSDEIKKVYRKASQKDIDVRVVSSQLLFRAILGDDASDEIEKTGGSKVLLDQVTKGIETLDLKKFIMTSLLTGKTSEGSKSFYIGKDDKKNKDEHNSKYYWANAEVLRNKRRERYKKSKGKRIL